MPGVPTLDWCHRSQMDGLSSHESRLLALFREMSVLSNLRHGDEEDIRTHDEVERGLVELQGHHHYS